MIDLGTLAGLLEHRHRLDAYCLRCDRWAVLDLARLIEDGRGELCIIGWQPRCSICGGHGLLQVRPPALRPGPATVVLEVLARIGDHPNTTSAFFAGFMRLTERVLGNLPDGPPIRDLPRR